MKINLHRTVVTGMAILLLIPTLVWSQYPIGHRNITYVDSTRSNRQIPTDVYYPATVAGDNTPVATPPGGGFPVVSFGHGFLLNVATYQYLWQALVPAGYIVALPRTEGSFSPNHQQLGFDLAFLIRKLRQEGSNNLSPFYGAVGGTACVMGHSMGGGSSFLAAQSDSTITAIANLAAAETNPSAIAAAANLSMPALLFCGTDDCVTPPANHQIPMYNALQSACKTRITITGGSHCKFGENNFTCNLGELGCPGSISRDTQHAIVIHHLLPFLDQHLKGLDTARCIFQERLEQQNGITFVQSCSPPSPPPIVISPAITGVTISWAPLPGVCQYELLRSPVPEFAYDTTLRLYQGSATQFEDAAPNDRAFYHLWTK